MATDLELAQERLQEAMALLSVAQEKAATEAALDRAVASGAISVAKRAELMSAEQTRFNEQRARVEAVGKSGGAGR